MSDEPESKNQSLDESDISVDSQKAELQYKKVESETQPESSAEFLRSLARIAKLSQLCLIATGAQGSVYLARHEILCKDVAVKVLPVLKDKESLARFQREARILASLNHPSVVKINSYGLTEQGLPYIVMEYIEGPNLLRYVESKGRLSVDLATDIVRQLADALQIINESGFVHRDIHPSNIVLRDDKTPVLLDFGISKLVSVPEEQRLTATAQILGNPAYMSPEQAAGKDLDHRSDQYSLACVFYFMLSGKQLFSGNTDLELMLKHANEAPDLRSASLNPSLKSVLERSLKKRPDERYPDLKQFRKALDSACLSAAVSSGGTFHFRSKPVIFAILFIALTSIALVFVLNQKGAMEARRATEYKAVEDGARSEAEYSSVMKLLDEGGDDFESKAITYLQTAPNRNRMEGRLQILKKLIEDLRHKNRLDEETSYAEQMQRELKSGEFVESPLSAQKKIELRFDMLEQVFVCNLRAKRLIDAEDQLSELKGLLEKSDDLRSNRGILLKYNMYSSQLLHSKGNSKDAAVFEKQGLALATMGGMPEEQIRDFYRFTIISRIERKSGEEAVLEVSRCMITHMRQLLENQQLSIEDLKFADEISRLLSNSGYKRGAIALSVEILRLEKYAQGSSFADFLGFLQQALSLADKNRSASIIWERVPDLARAYMDRLDQFVLENSVLSHNLQVQSIYDGQSLAGSLSELKQHDLAIKVIKHTMNFVSKQGFSAADRLFVFYSLVNVCVQAGPENLELKDLQLVQSLYRKVVLDNLRRKDCPFEELRKMSVQTVHLLRHCGKEVPWSAWFSPVLNELRSTSCLSRQQKLLFLESVDDALSNGGPPPEAQALLALLRTARASLVNK